MTTMPPESSPAVLHTMTAANTTSAVMHDYGDIAMFSTEVNDHAAAPAPLSIADTESTTRALDALAALAAASTAVVQSDSGLEEEEEEEMAASHHHHHHQSQPSQEQITSQHHLQGWTSDDDHSQSMPPPPPRSPTAILVASAGSSSVSEPAAPAEQTYSSSFLHNYPSSPHITASYIGGGRLRSASNPEGMEKWDLYSHRNDRQHFVLPSSILEEELASTRRVLGEVVDESGEYSSGNSDEISWDVSHGFALKSQSSKGPHAKRVGFLQHYSSASDARRSKRTVSRLGTSPDSVVDLDDASAAKSTNKNSSSSDNTNGSSNNSKPRKKSTRSASPSEIILKSPPSDEDDEENLEPEELLRRARARLLEDLSEGSGGGNGTSTGGLNVDSKGGVMILPHSLTKYKEVR